MSHSPAEPRRHRLNVADYYRMGEVGILGPDARVELIDGEIIDMPPPGPAHAGTVDHLVDVLARALAARTLLRVQNPLRLDEHSEPQPDILVLRRRADFYKSRHPLPTDVLLAMEVADTSLRFDRDVKAPLYAGAMIPELWLIDVRGKRLVRYRNPRQGLYASVDHPDLGTPIDVPGLPDTRIDLSTLFA